jgi:serine/threonine-protein kinase
VTAELRTLGPADLRDAAGRPIAEVLRQPKRLALLAYLALAGPHRLLRRDTILGLFWPDLDQQRGRAALRKTLHVLREALGADAIASRGDEEIGVRAEGLWCDVTAFEEALDEGRPRDALELYRGHLLEGFFVPGVSAELEQWLDGLRTRLRGRAVEAAWALSAQDEGEGSWADAVRWGRRGAELAPDDESQVRRLMALLDRMGDRVGALRTYEAFAARLLAEYDTEPAPETRELVQRIRARTESRLLGELPSESSATAGRSAIPAGAPADEATTRRSRLPGGAIGIAVAVAAFVGLWVISGIALPKAGDVESSRSAPAPNSVAVLYFDNLSSDAGDAYLADGLTEAMIARLGQVDRLVVMSRTAVRRFRDGSADPQTMGRAIGVAHLVSGSVRRTDGRLRVGVELVDAETGIREWGNEYEREEDDILAIEDAIAEAVATGIAGELMPREREALGARATSDVRAYRHYLHGNYLLAQRNPTAVARAIAEFESAVERDEAFTLARASAALAYILVYDWEWEYEGLSRQEVLDRGLATAQQALQEDSSSSEAWAALGLALAHRFPRTFQGAAAALERALELNPRNAAALHSFGVLLTRVGNDEAAEAMLHDALEAEPARPITLFVLAELAYRQRHHEEARGWLDSAIAVEPGFYFAYAFRGLARFRLGEIEQARGDAETAVRFSAGSRMAGSAVLVLVDARGGEESSARDRLERLTQEVQARGEATSQEVLWLAMAHIGLGDSKAALEILELAPHRSSEFSFWLRLPEFDPVRSDPRFQRLVEESRPRTPLRPKG